MKKRNRRPRQQACWFCGQPFTPVRSTAQFCSSGCRVKAHRGQVPPAAVQVTEGVTLNGPQPIDILGPMDGENSRLDQVARDGVVTLNEAPAAEALLEVDDPDEPVTLTTKSAPRDRALAYLALAAADEGLYDWPLALMPADSHRREAYEIQRRRRRSGRGNQSGGRYPGWASRKACTSSPCTGPITRRHTRC
jgi:hypothetical protein